MASSRISECVAVDKMDDWMGILHLLHTIRSIDLQCIGRGEMTG